MRLAFACAVLALAAPAYADDVLHPGTPVLDRPTLTALGVQWPITGDDNFNATVTVKYRVAGSSTFKDALPLFRVHPESVAGWTVMPQFAGSIFDLRPATTYEIQLHAVDPDGAVDMTMSLTGVTRSVPSDPSAPHVVNVVDSGSLNAALGSAQPGDVISLADGTYAGQFAINASGTADNPIVIRGSSMDGTIVDGMGCGTCNVLEVYGSFVHIERLTIRNANRALRFQTDGAEGNVIRRVHVQAVTLGFGSKPNQLDFYICDNILEGNLVAPMYPWPYVYTSDGGAHANDDGIHVEGFGHLVCHNRISGFGDAMKTEQDGARAVDFGNNDVLWTYDNGIELDGSEGNTRAFRNRFTNTYATLSFQPIFGGPAYAFRNVVVNVVNEQLKFHALAGTVLEEPSGMLVYNNTFVSPAHALNLQTSATSHHFAIENNLFYGPTNPDSSRTVDWTGGIDDGLFDYNGYSPNSRFSFNLSGTYQTFQNFAAVQTAGLETHGLIIEAGVFASGLTPPATYQTFLMPQDVTLAAGSTAIDRGVVLPNIDDGYMGAAPDLGAYEVGCAIPIYGPRPDGMDESNEPVGCTTGGGGSGGSGGSAGSGGSGTGGSGGNAAGGSTEGGCGCTVGSRDVGAVGHPLLMLGIVLCAVVVRRMRRE